MTERDSRQTGRGSHGPRRARRGDAGGSEGDRRLVSGRHAGIAVPLFSIPSRRSWGIGEIPDLIHLAEWLQAAGLSFVQLLPVNEMQDGQSSPYSALSAMAIDPIFISLDEVPELAAIGGEASLDAADRKRLDAARRSPIVDYEAVRALKHAALGRAFDQFVDAMMNRAGTTSLRARAFRSFDRAAAWWLDAYALFRAMHDENGGADWREWSREQRASDRLQASASLQKAVLRYKYYQWIAAEQWELVRRKIAPTAVLGDFPYMVSLQSADVWAREDEFDVDASVGVPPDAFSATGQDWGLPAYRWDVLAANKYKWLRDRARRCAELYDGFRIDHLVGFYRMFVRRPDGSSAFVPPDPPLQLALGEQVLGVLSGSGARILAEDLGTVPDFVRDSLARLGIPGMKVLRWERYWNVDGHPFRDPSAYPTRSVATSGTHDTETLAAWWDDATLPDRRALLDLAALASAGCRPEDDYSDRTNNALLDALYGAASELLILPMQDVFGWRDRINTPASVGEQNWTWRLPWPVEDLTTEPLAVERAGFLRDLSRRHRRPGTL